MKCRFLSVSILLALPITCIWSQAIQSNSALRDPGQQDLSISPNLPDPELTNFAPGEVHLLPSLFHSRRELTKAYLLRLETRNILQNHMLEAGIRIDDPSEDLHQGWEAPHYQLRGHFAGHWLSAMEHFAAIDNDPLIAARAREAVIDLKHFQDLNGGQWVGSVPVKYFEMLEEHRPVWSPQYTLHKTLMGLYDAYRYGHDEQALQVLENAADWFADWTQKLIDSGHGEVVYSGECAGMLELWADLYATSKDPKYLELASRYAMPDLFQSLLDGNDALTNDHANASIPWIQGAARLYEITGDTHYREIVESFWKQAVEERGMFATTGNNAGEFWIPPHQFGRFLGSRTQEHCTVYNMIRVAQYLLRWTGESRFADYIERALYNGILAQQNPDTGLIAYFLPLEPGAHKVWGSETDDFWCCHGTLVQAQAMYEDLIYYREPDGVTVSQFIPSEATVAINDREIQLSQTVDTSAGHSNFSAKTETTHWVMKLNVQSVSPETWTLRIRQPWWAIDEGKVKINGEPVEVELLKNGFLELNRSWSNTVVEVSFAKRITKELLPGDNHRIALLDGPIVLAAISETEPVISKDSTLTPQYEHQYVEGQDWQSGHYLLRSEHETVILKPLFEIADEPYSVYIYNSELGKED